MLGGIAALVLLALIAKGISDYGFENIYKGTIEGLKAQGKSEEEIIRTIYSYPISSELKAKLTAYIKKNSTSPH